MTKRGAFDFECWEWVNPRACGFLWGPANAREWECAIDKKSTNPERLACDALEMLARIAKEDGICEWWAHNGGRYDVAFILRAIQLLGWEATGHVAGGRVVVLRQDVPGGCGESALAGHWHERLEERERRVVENKDWW